MVLDTSAVVAILTGESDWPDLVRAIERDAVRLISAASVLEASLVMFSRLGPDGVDELDLLLSRLSCEIKPFAAQDLASAQQAFRRFGKGRHPAALNLGDCFSYALSVNTGEPLLFKGNDFSQTDIPPIHY